MPKVSEIDDIFAGKAGAPKAMKSSAAVAGPSSDKLTNAASPMKKRKKQSKASNEGEVGSEAPKPLPSASALDGVTQPKKRPAETILDPSLPQPSKKVKVIDDRPLAKAASAVKSKQKRKAEPDGEERAFRDSRGQEPRKKTEEGWNIYKEDELGIKETGGDTPLCPFDCDCCF